MAQNRAFPPHQKKNKKGKGRGKGKKGKKSTTNTTTNTNAAARNNENARPSTTTTSSSSSATCSASASPTTTTTNSSSSSSSSPSPTSLFLPPPWLGTPLTRATAIPGRIVWMPPFAANSTALKWGARPSAAEHPAVITAVDPLPSAPADGSSPAPKPTVKVLPITSWGGLKTAAEKWSVGDGGRALRAYYRLIANDRPPAVGGGEAVMEEAGVQVLRLRDGKRMRSRSYISLRDDKIIIEIEGLDLFSNGGDEDIFLEEGCLKELVADHRDVTLRKLNR